MAEGITNYAGSGERSKIAMRLAILAFVETLFFTILALVASYGNGWSGVGTFTLGAIPFGVSVILSVAAIFYGMLSKSATEEEYEKELLKKRKDSLHSLMDVSEDVRFTSGRTLANYLKYAPQVFCAIGFLYVAICLWKAYGTPAAYGEAGLPLPKSPMALAFVCVISCSIRTRVTSREAWLSKVAHVFSEKKYPAPTPLVFIMFTLPVGNGVVLVPPICT